MRTLLLVALLAWATTAHAQVRPVYMVDEPLPAMTYDVSQESSAATGVLYGLVCGGLTAFIAAGILYDDDAALNRGQMALAGFGLGFVVGLAIWAADERWDEGPGRARTDFGMPRPEHDLEQGVVPRLIARPGYQQ